MSILRRVWNITQGLPIDLHCIISFILHRYFATVSPVNEPRRKPWNTCIFIYLYKYIFIYKYIYIYVISPLVMIFTIETR